MPEHATPAELRARAKQHMAKWRELLLDDPIEAREELARASNLAMLAEEAEQALGGGCVMVRNDHYDDDVAADYRNEQSYFNSLSALPCSTETSVPRYFKGMDCPDPTTADVVYIDRLTGKEVLRYDGADPANTRFDYGAKPDAEVFAKRGLNIKETIDPAKAVISIAECQRHMRVDNWGDDGTWGDE